MLKKLVDTNNKALLFSDKSVLVETQLDLDLYGVVGWYKISKDLNEIDYSGNPATVSVWQDSIPRQSLSINFVAGSKISYTGITANDCIKFTDNATLPAGLVVNKRYFVLTVTSSQAQISDVRGGAAISFADGGTVQPAKEFNYAYQNTVGYRPKIELNYKNGFAALNSMTGASFFQFNKNVTIASFYNVENITTGNIGFAFLGLSPAISNQFSTWSIGLGTGTAYQNGVENTGIVTKNSFSDFYFKGTSSGTFSYLLSKVATTDSNNSNAGGYVCELMLFSVVLQQYAFDNLRAYSKSKFNY